MAIVILLILASNWRIDSLVSAQTLGEKSHLVKKVKLETVSRHSFVEWAFAEGTVHAARRDYLQLESSGIVTELGTVNGKLIREGIKVNGPQNDRPGDLLMRIDTRAQSAEKKAVLAQVIEARTAMEQAEREFNRADKIYQRQLISKNEFEKYRAVRDARRAAYNVMLAQRDRSQVTLDKAILRAPFDGIITRVNVREGDYYTGAKPAIADNQREINAAIVLMDTGQYEAILNLPLWREGQISLGQTVYLSTSNNALAQASNNGFNDGEFAIGTIESISPSISLDKRSVTVKVLTDSGAEHLRDGAFVTAWIVSQEKNDVISISESALHNYESGTFVFVYQESNQTVKQQSLTVGSTGRGLVEVLQGLKEGEKIVVEGGNLLTDGTPVVVVGS